MAVLTKQTIGQSGIDLTFAAASAGGDTVASPSRSDVLLVRNDDVSSKTVTIAVPGNTWNNQTTPDTAVVVPAGEITAIKLDPRYTATGVASISYSAVTSVTVAAIVV